MYGSNFGSKCMGQFSFTQRHIPTKKKILSTPPGSSHINAHAGSYFILIYSFVPWAGNSLTIKLNIIHLNIHDIESPSKLVPHIILKSATFKWHSCIPWVIQTSPNKEHVGEVMRASFWCDHTHMVLLGRTLENICYYVQHRKKMNTKFTILYPVHLKSVL